MGRVIGVEETMSGVGVVDDNDVAQKEGICEEAAAGIMTCGTKAKSGVCTEVGGLSCA